LYETQIAWRRRWAQDCGEWRLAPGVIQPTRHVVGRGAGGGVAGDGIASAQASVTS
jgi:hypothetical protein